MIKFAKINILHLYQVLILLTPILNNYMFVPIQFVYIVCALGFLLFLYMTAHNKIKISGKVLIYAGYVVLFSLIAGIFMPDFSLYHLLVRMGYFLLVIVNFYIFAYQIWDFERCFKLYRNLCYFLSALIIIQFVLGQIGAGVSLIPPDMTTNTAEFMSSNVYRLNQVLDRRFSTFFLEPAHQAQYCLPCLALIFFSDLNTSKKTMLPAVLLTGGLLTTTSMQGILGAGVIWLVYLFVMIKEEKLKGFQRLFVLIPLAVVSVYFLWSQPVLQEQFQKKLMSFNRGQIYRGTSLYVRMIYGWDCYKELGFIQKIFGYGYSNSGTYLLNSGIGLRFTSIGLIGYMSGLSRMFCELGIIGVLLNFNIVLFPLLKKQQGKRDLRIFGLILTIAVIMLTSAAFDNLSSLLPLTFALSIYTKNGGLDKC